MRKKILISLFALTIGMHELKAQQFVIDETNVAVLNKVLKKLVRENEALKKEIAEIKSYCIKNQNNFEQSKEIVVTRKEHNISQYVVTAWTLNLRNAPTHINSKIVKTLSIGQILDVEGRLLNDSWLKTKDGLFFNGKYAKKANEVTLKVKERAVIRQKPIEDTTTFLKEVNSGVKLEAVGELRDWYILKGGNFIYKGYVIKIEG